MPTRRRKRDDARPRLFCSVLGSAVAAVNSVVLETRGELHDRRAGSTPALLTVEVRTDFSSHRPSHALLVIFLRSRRVVAVESAGPGIPRATMSMFGEDRATMVPSEGARASIPPIPSPPQSYRISSSSPPAQLPASPSVGTRRSRNLLALRRGCPDPSWSRTRCTVRRCTSWCAWAATS